MGIGASIFLLAVGAILTFAVEASISGLDLEVIGIILMISGALGLALSMIATNRSRSAPAYTEERVVTRDRDVY